MEQLNLFDSYSNWIEYWNNYHKKCPKCSGVIVANIDSTKTKYHCLKCSYKKTVKYTD